MNLKEIKIALIKKDKTLVWLAQQLDYSSTYLYKVINDQNKKEINRIKNILRGE